MSRARPWRSLTQSITTQIASSRIRASSTAYPRIPIARTYHTYDRSPSWPRPWQSHARYPRCQKRHDSDQSAARPLTDSARSIGGEADKREDSEAIAARKAQEPAYEITFTCRKCLTRSTHRVTKQAYHYGTTLITCPGCKNRHLISDHLKIFSDSSLTLEDILKDKGEHLKKGRLGEDGDIEFYEDTPEHRHEIQALEAMKK